MTTKRASGVGESNREGEVRQLTTPTPEARFFLVRLEDNLPGYRVAGLFHAIRQHPGIEMVCDLSVVSQATLDVILLKPSPLLEREEPSTYNAIRQHHRRKLQPELKFEAAQ